MMIAKKKISLDDVLNEYLTAEAKPNHKALEKWVKRFPEYRDQLIEFTVKWSRAENAPMPNQMNTTENETLVLRAMSIVGDRIHAMREKEQKEKTSIKALSDELKKRGSNIKLLAESSGLSVPIIAKIDRGFINPNSIPKKAVQRIAEGLDRTIEDVWYCIQNTTMTAQNIRFSSTKQPEMPFGKENFFDAIRNDRELGEDQRIFWLNFEHD